MSFFPKKNFLSDYAESFDDFMAYDQKPPANPVKHYLKLPNGQFFGPVEFLKEGIKFKGVIPKEGVMVITELANPTDIFCISPSEEMQIAYQIMYAKLKPEYIDQETKNVVAYILKWEMVTVALDSLYELLRRFYVTATTVQNQTSRIHVLTQLLNDSSLFRSLTQVIIETADRIEDGSPRNEFRENSALSAIRLLWIAISHRSSMADAIRNADSNIIISSLDAILLSPLPDRNATNYITLLMAFVEESDFLLNHTFYVIKILRELCCQRPSLQSRLVQAFLPHQQILKDRFAQLTSIANRDVAISPLDVSLLDLEECDSASIRGDIIRQIVELMIDSLEIDSKQNVAFLLLGFNMTNIQATRVITEDSFGEGTSCLHSFLQIIEAFITAENPFDLPYSALFEPTLRLLLKLVSFNSTSSNIMLRYLRSSNDLIYRLVTCPAFKNIDPVQNIDDVNVDVSYNILRRAIQGIILHLVALEVSTMLKSGHISEPERFYATLLFIKEHAIENGNTSANENSMIIEEQPKDVALLWDLLENSKAEAASIAPPVLEKFDPKKIDDLLKYCLRTSTLGVEQMDVEYIHFLLNMEINSIINEDINLIRSEGKEIMLYCTKYNSRRLLEAACVQLLSGWISMINVISFFAPVNFIDKEIQKHFLRDALYLLLKYARDVDMNPENLSAVSNSIFRLVRAICGMVKRQEANLDLRKVELSYILSTLLECLVLPGYSKCVAFKMDIYGSILCVFGVCIIENVENSTETNQPKGFSLADLFEEKKAVDSKWRPIFYKLAEEIVRTITADVIFAPFALKVVSITCLTEILQEDIRGSQEIALQFARSGTIRCILDTVGQLKFKFDTDAKDREHEKAALYFESVLGLFIRVASTTAGWTALIDNSLLEKLIDLELWRNPPKEIFTSKDMDNLSTSSMHYLRILDTLFRLCMALCSSIYWKSVSFGLLQFIEMHKEVLNQLIRVQPEHFLLKTAAAIVYYIYTLDDTTREVITSSKCLEDIRKLRTEGPPKPKFALSNPAFNTPLNLFPSIQAPMLGRQ